jgi:hypothetical protein
MVDASFSRQKQQEDRAVVRGRRLRVLAVALAVILIGLGCAMVWGFGARSVAALPSSADAAGSASAREQVSNELLETAKGLQVTQQQAVDPEALRADRCGDREA